MPHRSGFSLLELSVVIALIIFLSMLALPNFSRIFSKVKRAEAYMQLRSLHIAQKAYYAEHGIYAKDLSSLDWKPEGTLYYTYGIGKNSKNKQYILGSLQTPATQLADVFVHDHSFVASAAGDIDGDEQPDVLTITETGKITLVVDDLA